MVAQAIINLRTLASAIRNVVSMAIAAPTTRITVNQATHIKEVSRQMMVTMTRLVTVVRKAKIVGSRVVVAIPSSSATRSTRVSASVKQLALHGSTI